MNLGHISGNDFVPQVPTGENAREMDVSVSNVDSAEFLALSLCYSRSQPLRHLTQEDTTGERP